MTDVTRREAVEAMQSIADRWDGGDLDWVKGYMWKRDVDKDEVVACCLVGGLLLATGERTKQDGYEAAPELETRGPVYRAAVQAVAAAIWQAAGKEVPRHLRPPERAEGLLSYWNDFSDRTVREVIETVRSAARTLEDRRP